MFCSQARKCPPELAEGQVLFTLHHKDLRSFVNQAVDALKYAGPTRHLFGRVQPLHPAEACVQRLLAL